jgi:hypothetical protein
VASQMAEGLHIKLGELIYASNQAPNAQLYFVRKQVPLATEAAMLSQRSSDAPPIEIRPQRIREEATVYAVFAIE